MQCIFKIIVSCRVINHAKSFLTHLTSQRVQQETYLKLIFSKKDKVVIKITFYLKDKNILL